MGRAHYPQFRALGSGRNPRYANPIIMSALRYYPMLAAGAGAALLGYVILSRRSKKSPEQLELERRTELAQGGRIIDGNITDVQELEDDVTGRQMILLIYTYDVAGVTYEASQDVTHLRQFIDVYSCRLGLPASIRYDPHNPGDSIVISETWSGLRKPAIRLKQSQPGEASGMLYNFTSPHI
jgi:hypothetical protein